MLGGHQATAILPVVDLPRAKKFYGDTLGLKLREERETGEVMYEAGTGTLVTIYKRPTPTTADHTALGFRVDDIDKVVGSLRSKGVKFEEYDMPQMNLKTVNGIATIGAAKAAWFKDPDGNILSVVQVM